MRNRLDYSIVLSSLFLLVMVLFLLQNRKNTIYLPQNTQTKSDNLYQDVFSFPFYESQLLGTWYLKGYTNASITFKKEKGEIGNNTLNVKSESIDQNTLNSFPNGSYLTEMRGNNLNEIIDFYNIKLINGKLGTLYLTRDNQTLEFLRYKVQNAKKGVFKTNCGCSVQLSCGN